MADGIKQEAADLSANDSNKPPESAGRQGNTSLGGPTGPTTQRGKQKSRQNATKHGIFAVGILRKRESEAEYLSTVEDMAETLQPVGGLEEILVEKLAMLVWRYRRLLQAEAAEVECQAEYCEQDYMRRKCEGVDRAKGDQGLILYAILHYNEVVLEAAIASLRELHRQIGEKGLDWERDRKALGEVYGSLPEAGVKDERTYRPTFSGEENDEQRPAVSLVRLASRYRELADTSKDQQSAPDVPPGAAESIASLLTEDIEKLELMLKIWRRHGDGRNRLEEIRRLVPWERATDRLQRYEASLDRSFDRTLSQLERLQRLRLGQPVLPALKVDVSHSP